ncbi:hypothetical protein T4D_10998 [Trichinella pseudospiralis]|uniref:Uncharacterized protein n=1 Tax=Trichinella pseudospiralis TaxID=6337 RepID=A0A0V1EI10_TRIPS|nr:hypothetical protein T4D_10998 [Trichinella pseudospiralis]
MAINSIGLQKEPGNLTEIEIFTTGYIPCQEQACQELKPPGAINTKV